ncbi:MAG: zinc-binding dehydrogenase, partial [Vicinamibacteria bacterium]
PKPKPGQLILEVERTNICGTELHFWRGDIPVTGVPGHELVGRVVAAGEGVKEDSGGKPVKPGDRVAPVYFTPCRECVQCRAGQQNACTRIENHFLGFPESGLESCGSFATHYVMIPGQPFYKVPRHIPSRIASSANCALSQVYFGLDQVGLRRGETVYIQGAGGLGIHATALAKERGARVVIADGVASRLEAARNFGADEVVDIRRHDTSEKRLDELSRLTDSQGADVVVGLVGYPDVFKESIMCARPGGRILEMGTVAPGSLAEIDVGFLVIKNIRIAFVLYYNPEYLEKALRFLSKNVNKYPYDQIADQEFALSEIALALERTDKRELNRATLVP